MWSPSTRNPGKAQMILSIARTSFRDLGRLRIQFSTYDGGTVTPTPTQERMLRGLVLDRDANAARNLLHLAASGAESLNACGGTVRPGHARRVPVKQEPGARHRGKTGTVPAQAGTAA